MRGEDLPLDYVAPNCAIGPTVHEATLKTDLHGLEAAAATALKSYPVSAWMKAKVEQPIVVKFDQPFVFAVIDRSTGAILFLGQFAEP